jgi:hypothetical protein
VEELETAVAAATTLSDVLRALGLRPAGGNHRSIRAWIDRLGISTEHFARRPPPGRTHATRPLAELLVEGSRCNRGRLKERLYAEGLKARACESCGQGELWRGQRIALILDHVNGVGDDNRLENLQIVCPNCAAALETHCGRQLALDPKACEQCGTEFKPGYGTQRFCSQACFHEAPRPPRGPQPARRRVERPPLAQLLAEVKADGFAATGRRYGVSDNAIRKWILAAEREERA